MDLALPKPRRGEKENPMRCTTEHIIPLWLARGAQNNQVLAHAYCNQNRETLRFPHDPVYGGSANAN